MGDEHTVKTICKIPPGISMHSLKSIGEKLPLKYNHYYFCTGVFSSDFNLFKNAYFSFLIQQVICCVLAVKSFIIMYKN